MFAMNLSVPQKPMLISPERLDTKESWLDIYCCPLHRNESLSIGIVPKSILSDCVCIMVYNPEGLSIMEQLWSYQGVTLEMVPG